MMSRKVDECKPVPGTVLSRPVARGTSAEGAKYTAVVQGHAHTDGRHVSNAALGRSNATAGKVTPELTS
jgi:hypothetical protein